MTKNYKILTSYVRDISSKISGTENFIYLKDNIPKYSLGIDINSIPLKNNMAEVNIKLNFSEKKDEKNNENEIINFCKKVIKPSEGELKEHQNFLKKSLKKNYF